MISPEYAEQSQRYAGRYTTPDTFEGEMLLDDKTAIVSPRAFDELLEYSSSIPSGVFFGKVWKRQLFGRDPDSGRVVSQGWMLGQYGAEIKRGHVSIIWRDLIVVE